MQGTLRRFGQRTSRAFLHLSWALPPSEPFLGRCPQIDRNVEREIINHRMLNHPNIIGFKEVRCGQAGKQLHVHARPIGPPPPALLLLQVFLTPTHLGIAMEYAAGGELFERIVRAGRFSEDEARYFFQQLVSGVDYCHRSVGWWSLIRAWVLQVHALRIYVLSCCIKPFTEPFSLLCAGCLPSGPEAGKYSAR